jgi:hypothetical protein
MGDAQQNDFNLQQTSKNSVTAPEPVQAKLETIATLVQEIAAQYQSDSLALLALLRTLEALHQGIRDGLFQAALPDNRQALYALLRDIEADGGWPYIHRMRLQSFLSKLPAAEIAEIELFCSPSENGSSSPSKDRLHNLHRSPMQSESLEW